ncbi:MAG: GNAT family N-acetyltransferase, partial [Desulfuromonadales bacterium]
LYAGFIEDSAGLFLVAENRGIIIGFAAGTTNPSGFFRRLLQRRGIRFARAATSGLLRNPLLATRKCLGALFYRGETPNGIPDAALLSSLAVSPSTQSKGIGQALVRAFADEARKCGCQSVYLTTDEANNEKANRFYAKCGFQLLDTFNRSGNRVMNRWTMRLT